MVCVITALVLLNGGSGGEVRTPSAKAAITKFEAAWNKHDAAAVANGFVPHGSYRTTKGDLILGHAKILARLSTTFASPEFATSSLAFEVTHSEVLAPDIELLDTTWAMTGHKLSDDSKPVRRGVATIIVRRVNGEFKLVALRASLLPTSE